MAFGSPYGQPADPTELDPLFYRGRSSVLGAPVEVRSSGQLPADFPQAGPAPTAPTKGSSGPKPTDPGQSYDFAGPDFSLEFPTEPTAPTGPQSLSMPGQPGTPWWAQALAALGVADKAYGNIQKLRKAEGGLAAESSTELSGGYPDWVKDPTAIKLFGSEDSPLFDASRFSVDPGISGSANVALDPAASVKVLGSTRTINPAYLDWLDPDVTPAGALGPPPPTGIPAAASSATDWLGAAGAGLQTAGGLYGLVAGPNDRARALGAANTLGGAAGLLSSLGLASSAVGSLAPAFGLATLPIVLGGLYEMFTRKDTPNFPQGYAGIKGQDNAAVDPTTGAVLWYQGKGKYDWSPETQQGTRATPESFREWGIVPQGQLLQIPEYRQVALDLVKGRPASEIPESVRQLPEIQAQIAQYAATYVPAGTYGTPAQFVPEGDPTPMVRMPANWYDAGAPAQAPDDHEPKGD